MGKNYQSQIIHFDLKMQVRNELILKEYFQKQIVTFSTVFYR